MKTTNISKPSYVTEMTVEELITILRDWLQHNNYLEATKKAKISDIRLRKCNNSFEIYWS